MTVTISRAILNTILVRAAAATGSEICGLLLGEGDRIREAREAMNISTEPERRFELDPVTLLTAHKEARAGGPAVLGHYHSHPGGSVEPSACDAEMAQPDGALWLICAPDGRYALWRAGTEGLHGRFSDVELLVEHE
jgi:proteasome lid subunit RPN8/RPN11